MPWGFAAAAVGTVAGAVISSNAAGDAADQQAQSSANSIAEQRRQFDLQREDSAPYRAAGTQALGQLQTDINTPTTAADVMSDPGYAFGQQQGQLGLDRKIAAGGGRISGAALKASSRFNTDYASTGYNAAYQRRQDRLNRLSALAGIGQTATASSSAAGAQSANAISSLISGQGNASAASTLAQGNIWGNATNQLSALYGRTSQTGGYNNSSDPTYGAGYSGSLVNQGSAGGDVSGSYWGIE